MIDCESILESDLVRLLEFSPGVVSYEQQPEEITYWDGKGMRKCHPDMGARLTDDSVVHFEVKWAAELQRAPIADKYRAVATHYQTHRTEQYKIVTELELRREPLYSNVLRLSYMRPRGRFDGPTSDALRDLLGSNPIAWARAESRLGTTSVWRLLAAGHLSCDLTQCIAADTPVFITMSCGGSHAEMFV